MQLRTCALSRTARSCFIVKPGFPQISTDKTCACKNRIFLKMRIPKIRPIKDSSCKIRTIKMRFLQAGSREVCSVTKYSIRRHTIFFHPLTEFVRHDVLHMGTVKLRLRQIGSFDVGMLQECPRKIRPGEIGSGKLRVI